MDNMAIMSNEATASFHRVIFEGIKILLQDVKRVTFLVVKIRSTWNSREFVDPVVTSIKVCRQDSQKEIRK